MKIRTILYFSGSEAQNIPGSIHLDIMEIADIENIGGGNYKAIIEISENDYQASIFSDNVCSMIASYLDTTGFNAEIESCEIISTSYQRGGLVKKYAKGGTIDTQIETDLKTLQDIKHGNYPFIDSNDPEIQEALKGIDSEPTDTEIKELIDKTEKAIEKRLNKYEPKVASQVISKQKIEQKIKGFEILLKLAKSDESKAKIQQKIKGFKILLKLKK